MNSFIKNLLTVFLFLTGFFVFSGAHSVEACEIVSGQTSIRPQGWFTINQYEDDPRPFVYLDVKTIDCNTTGGNIFRVLLQNIQFSTTLSFGIEVVPIQEIKIALTDSTSSPNGSTDFQSTTSDFSIPLLVGERGVLGGCEAVAGIEDCIIAIKIFNDSITGSPEIFNLSQNGSGLMYECDYSCQTYWQLGCPVGAGQAPNPLPYGGICSTDNTTIDITTTGVINTGGVVSGEYSTTPLAPLPGFTGDPDVGQWLESLFTILIVVAGLLALIMIVVGGITYLTSESFGEKGKGKSYIVNAITGLVLALGAWVILNTINPELAEDLNIKIPTVTLDGPTREWDNGNATPGTNIAPTAMLNGQPIVMGMPWPDDSQQRGQLSAAGISVSSSGNSNCTPTAGTPNCTSVYFDSTAESVIGQIISFKNSCNCEMVITGGSEAWLHSTHGPNKKIIDMRATESLNTYLNGLPGGPSPSANFPSGQTINIDGVGSFYAEPSGSTGNTTAKHWHITFN